jgi:spore coat polysaccharide biosynthesis protein SpsF
MKIVAIIQARMGSSRLPGKILRRLLDDTVLGHVVKRARAAGKIDQVVVATTLSSMDEVVVREAERLGVTATRGSEVDVLDRFYRAARQVQADVIVRITSDCPLLDPALVDDMVGKFMSLKAGGASVDYLSNTVIRTYPRGLDAEVFTFDALEKAHTQAASTAEREHVTPYLYRHSEVFRIEQYTGQQDLSHHRWTLDTIEDWQLLSAIFDHFGRPDFSTAEVCDFLNEHPAIACLNVGVEQKAMGH